ncbi:MAG: cytochrome b/b6 domain-containing protein [bacterium]
MKLLGRTQWRNSIGTALIGAILFLLIVWGQHILLDTLKNKWVEECFHLLRNGVLLYIALGLFVAIGAGTALHHRLYGFKDKRPRGPGDDVPWWGWGERLVHWSCVAAFVLLLVTGVQLYFAGAGLPDATTRLMRSWHFNEAFALTGMVLFLLWFGKALPRRYDFEWLRHWGGYLGYRGHLRAGKFNAGQKIWFWVFTVSGILMVLTGYQLQHHFSRLDPEYYTVLVLHLGAATGFLAFMGIHLYFSVIAVKGALSGMIRGRIGLRGARHLHSEALPPDTGHI